MQKLILPLLFVIASIAQSHAQQRLFDQHVQLKNCNVSIEANFFIATTVVEMEFYNPRDQEVEAYQGFSLNRGQVITDFQLELDGKYRVGSIEESWKARQAYSSIVGKRIDPALLRMNWNNQYSINIYPVPARSSRKIKFTITQMMVAEDLKLSYLLPLHFDSAAAQFNLSIKIINPSAIPNSNKGLIEKQFFNMKNDEATLLQQSKNIVLNKPISFSISQFTNKPQFCINKKNGKASFLMRLFPDTERYYASTPGSINVYWDVSLSGNKRNLEKELDFLEEYISVNKIDKTTIILFNQELQGVFAFNRQTDNFKSIRHFLLNYNYTGATRLGNLNFSNVLADAVLVFSDGVNSMGKSQARQGAVKVSFVTSGYNYQYDNMKRIIGSSGGSIISLYNTDVKKAVKKIDSAENFLLKYTATNIRINESFPMKLGGSVLLSGVVEQADNLELFYGNNSSTIKSENYFFPVNDNCDEITYKKMQMLKAYDSIVYGNGNYYNYNWQNVIVFGLTEKVVTPQTSYLVLERIEDYIKYKIAPPEELVEKCAALNYVYKSEYKIKALKDFTEQEPLELLAKEYNKHVYWWSKDEELIDLSRVVPVEKANNITATSATAKSTATSQPAYAEMNNSTGGGLKEVVVTSAFGIKRTARSTASNVQHLTNEQVNIIRQLNVNNALAGKVAGAQVRSQPVAKLGAETTIRLRGENGFGIGTGALYVVDGTIMPSGSDINPDDVEDYTVLQGPAASALFGPDGANGAIVVTLKRGKRNYGSYYSNWSEYKYSSLKDEDYVVAMKNAAGYELMDTYKKLEEIYKYDVGFYFEMADFFFEKKHTEKAQELMYNAIELCSGESSGLILAAYIYEKWKWFDKAIAVYKGILDDDADNLLAKRDLALAYFQNKNFEIAVKTYYDVITATDDHNYNINIKGTALSEMNAILALHKSEFNISYINPNLIKPLPVDLRIIVESNYGRVGNTEFVEPGTKKCNSVVAISENGGKYTGSAYYSGTNNLNEYNIKAAPAGSYKVTVAAHNNYSSASQVPMYIRVISFKNFQKQNMEMEIKMFDLDNQYGIVQLDDVKW